VVTKRQVAQNAVNVFRTLRGSGEGCCQLLADSNFSDFLISEIVECIALVVAACGISCCGFQVVGLVWI